MIKIIGFIGLLSILISCNSDVIYQKSYTFEGNEWKQEVKPHFEFEVKDTAVAYDFIISVRTTTDYKFSNMWVFLNTTTPKGEKGREPHQIFVTYPDGSWCGNKTGSVVENRLIFKRRKMPYKGKYLFTLEQGITEKKLTDILDVTFIVEKTKLQP